MKNKLYAGLATSLLLVGISGTSMAALLTADSVSYTGDGIGWYHYETKMIDGIIPVEHTDWRVHTTYWGGTGAQFTIDYGALFLIEDLVVSVDNNDYYTVEYSTDHSTWSNLFDISKNVGEQGYGMDTMSTVAGNTEYIASLDFTTVTAQYLRIFATGGDNSYSVGEIQAYGIPNAVPEPATMLLFGTGLAGLVGSRMRKKKK